MKSASEFAREIKKSNATVARACAKLGILRRWHGFVIFPEDEEKVLAMCQRRPGNPLMGTPNAPSRWKKRKPARKGKGS